MVTLWLIGDLSDEVLAPLLDRVGSSQVTRAGDLTIALRWLDQGHAPPELVVVAQSRGGTCGHAELEALRGRAPLARVWRMLGSWCEGEARSGQPPPGCMSTYWHQWQPRFSRELERAERGESPSWALPPTATADERLLSSELAEFADRQAGAIVVCSPSAAAAAALVDLCRGAGYGCLRVASDADFRLAGAAAVLWDADAAQIVDAEAVARLIGNSGGAPIVAMVGFPRADDVQQACRLGLAAVVSKPFLAADLLWQVERAMRATEHPG